MGVTKRSHIYIHREREREGERDMIKEKVDMKEEGDN
jgi:hypothetical protein